MQMPGSDETFTYHQVAETDENGEFSITVPYSTTGYDEWGPERGPHQRERSGQLQLPVPDRDPGRQRNRLLLERHS